MAALRKRGAYVWKVHGGPMTPAGLPDIVGVYRGQFIGVEVKMPGEAPSAIQNHRRGQLLATGAHVVVAQNVPEALRVLDGECTPATPREALTDDLGAPSERPVRTRSVRGPSHVAELLSGPRFID